MPWSSSRVSSEILGVHAALVPSGPQGEVVLFGGDEHWSDQQESAGNQSWQKTRIYDVATHSIVAGQVQSPESDVFCAHHAFIGDGRLLIAGGTSEWPADHDGHNHALDFLGHSRCWLYNPRQRAWVETSRLNRNPDQPNEPRSGGRWYPGLVTLGDGSVVAFFGHLDKNDFRHRNTLPERFLPSSQTWMNLPAAIAKDGEPDQGGRRYLFFPRAYTLPSGNIFSVTPLPAEFAAAAGESDGDHYSTAFNPFTGQYTTPRAAAADGVHTDWNLPAVLLPLLPGEVGYRARALFWSDAQARYIDIDAPTPVWQNAGDRDPTVSGRQRTYSNAVLLPTGQVCAIGGVSTTDPEDPLLQAEIYTPDINWATNQYGSGGGTWALDPSTAMHARNYHSVALLLPNGKVWVAGGNTNALSGHPDDDVLVGSVTKKRGIKVIELYEPPYIAIVGRVQIAQAPSLIGYGQEFDVQLDRAVTEVVRAAVLRNGSVTHSTDNDQRYVGLEIVSRTGNTLRLKSPPSGNVAPPGYYMLWLIDNAGAPCQRARFVRIAHLACRVIMDRSTYSQDEVLAIGAGTHATFSQALYVDFDGFRSAELSGPPAFSLEWGDGGSVSSGEVTLQFASRFDEASPPHPDVPCRTTFAYDVVFPTMAAFSGLLDRRDLLVRFTLGPHVCTAVLELTVSPNPYMIDVDPVQHNEAWLSTDVRVLKVRSSETKLGVSQGLHPTAPGDFIRQVVDRLRSGAESFDSIPVSGSDSVLDGAYMSGHPALPTFNYAVARVRYRATTTTAERVKCFFRLCNAAATDLSYNTDTMYRRSSGPAPVPLLGTAGGQLASIPFFFAPRVNTVAGQEGAASMSTQSLDASYDIQDIVPLASGGEVTAYFGCYLDINVPTKRFPLAPTSDGPFSEADALPIRDLLRSWHSCLLAEIFFDQDPTRPGAGPSQSDNLAQRNLTIIGLENPGAAASRMAMHTFEVAPSSLPLKGPAPYSRELSLGAVESRRYPRPDELFFDWHNLPHDAEVTLYFSDIDMAEVRAMLFFRISPASFTLLDSSSIRFKSGECAWLPLPGGRTVRIPALISITLPAGIVEGQTYRVSIRQVNGHTNRIVGSISIEMPVSKAVFLKADAERQLSFMSHVARTIPVGDRWRPIFDRYIGYLGARVDALGGSARDVSPNPDGTGKPYTPGQWRPGDRFPKGGFGSREQNDRCAAEPRRCPPSLAWAAGAVAGCSLAIIAMLACRCYRSLRHQAGCNS